MQKLHSTRLPPLLHFSHCSLCPPSHSGMGVFSVLFRHRFALLLLLLAPPPLLPAPAPPRSCSSSSRAFRNLLVGRTFLPFTMARPCVGTPLTPSPCGAYGSPALRACFAVTGPWTDGARFVFFPWAPNIRFVACGCWCIGAPEYKPLVRLLSLSSGKQSQSIGCSADHAPAGTSP